MQEKEWLQSLKAGDEVFISGYGYSRGLSTATVFKVTATQIVIDTRRYRKIDGRRIGGSSYSSSHLIQPTDANKEEVYVNTLCRKAARMKDALKIPTDRATLEALISALAPFMPKG